MKLTIHFQFEIYKVHKKNKNNNFNKIKGIVKSELHSILFNIKFFKTYI